MEQLLFSSIGMPIKTKRTIQACGIAVFICGAILIAVAQARETSWTGYEYYILGEDARMLLLLIGGFSFVAGSILLVSILFSPVNKARLFLYESYLKGVQVTPYQKFTISYQDIASVEISPMQTNLLIVKTAITTYAVFTENITLAHSLLCKKVMEKGE